MCIRDRSKRVAIPADCHVVSTPKVGPSDLMLVIFCSGNPWVYKLIIDIIDLFKEKNYNFIPQNLTDYCCIRQEPE